MRWNYSLTLYMGSLLILLQLCNNLFIFSLQSIIQYRLTKVPKNISI